MMASVEVNVKVNGCYDWRSSSRSTENRGMKQSYNLDYFLRTVTGQDKNSFTVEAVAEICSDRHSADASLMNTHHGVASMSV